MAQHQLGTIEQVLPLLGPAQGLWFLTTTHAALRRADTLTHTGQGQSVLSALNSAALPYQAAVQPVMDQALGPLRCVADIQPYLWQKLAINAVINPLTAIYNCPNGELAKTRWQPQIASIVQEVCQVAGRSGCALAFAPTLQSVQQVIARTAQNFSSMQQDIAHQRRTEIDAINGYVVRQAAHYGLAVPHNSQLQQQVLQLQQEAGIKAGKPPHC